MYNSQHAFQFVNKCREAKQFFKKNFKQKEQKQIKPREYKILKKYKYIGILSGSFLLYKLCLNDQQKINLNSLLESSISTLRGVKLLIHSIFLYQSNLNNLEYNSLEYIDKRSEINKIVAQMIFETCVKNQGIYLKIGQYIGSLDKILPQEYTQILGVLQDRCPPTDYEIIKIAFENDFNSKINQTFKYFNKTPISSASIAQVHEAQLKNGTKVAVKIQYPKLQQQAVTDRIMIKNLLYLASKACQYYGYEDIDFYKQIECFEKSLFKELDFQLEIENAEKTRKNFKDFKEVYIPKYYKKISNKRVITMEYIDGVKINDLEQLKQYKQLRNILLKIFAKMIFIDGHIHCDAHPGNILVRNHNNKPQIVLLDHGFYSNLDDKFRLQFCKLWLNMCVLNVDQIMKICQDLNIKNYQYIPLIFVGRSVQSRSKLGDNISQKEREILKNQNHFKNISELFQSLPQDMIYIMRCILLVSIHNLNFGGNRRQRIFQFSSACLEGVETNKFKRFLIKLKFYIQIYFYEFLYLF